MRPPNKRLERAGTAVGADIATPSAGRSAARSADMNKIEVSRGDERPQMPPTVSDDVLLRGAWYAIQQAGYLLEHAVILFDAGVHSSAVALALLGREELGRYAILCDLWRKASAGSRFSPDDVRKACRDHVEKHRRGTFSLVYRTSADTGFGKLLSSLVGLLPSGGAARKIRESIEKIDKLKAKRLPDERHATRMRSLYVDLNEAGSDWVRPSSITEAEARTTVQDAVNDYSVQRDRLTTPGILAAVDPSLAKAFESQGNRPALPGVRRPQYPQAP
jgi:AbiV family abortive infection protein